MISVLLQTDALPVLHKAMRDQFQTGESIFGTLVVLLGLAALVVLAYALTECQRRKAAGLISYDDPQRLFRDVLDKLDLQPSQRRMLRTAARDMNLRHPTVILLSETLFDRHTSKWLHRRSFSSTSKESTPSEGKIADVRAQLFPLARSPSDETRTTVQSATPA